MQKRKLCKIHFPAQLGRSSVSVRALYCLKTGETYSFVTNWGLLCRLRRSHTHAVCKCVCLVAEDSDGKRVPAAVGDGLADQRVVQDHPERHQQAGEVL